MWERLTTEKKIVRQSVCAKLYCTLKTIPFLNHDAGFRSTMEIWDLGLLYSMFPDREGALKRDDK